MKSQEYPEFVDRAYHDAMMAQGYGVLVALVVLAVVVLVAFAI